MLYATSEKGLSLWNRKINPLTLILINALIPFINTVFPSNKGILFTLAFGFLIVLVSGCYKKALKISVFLIIFFLLYAVTLLYLENGVLASMFRMSLLFLPCFMLASLLITEYNSSEILSGLEKLRLPKIFAIGLTVTIRYIPTFRNEFRIIKDAMYIRGVKFSIKHPVKTFEYLLVPQLFRCLNLSSELTAAGLTKGISAPHKRTNFFEQKFSAIDYSAFIILIVGHILIIGNAI